MASNHISLLYSPLLRLFLPLLVFSLSGSASRLLFERFFWPPVSTSPVPELLIPPVLPSSPQFDDPPFATTFPPPPPPPTPTFPVFQEPLLPPVGTFLPRFPFPNIPTLPTVPSVMPAYPFPPGIQQLGKKQHANNDP